jgi:alpha-beta hydrolase superfamily lysophospholipase
MKKEEGEYTGYDGKRMFMVGWQPDGEAKALVLGIPGLGSHGSAQFFIGEAFASNGYAYMTHDTRGFGHYDGIKGHVDSFDEIIDDLDCFTTQMQERFPSKKTFMFGHSFGGLVILLYVLEYAEKIDGIMIPGPSVTERLEIGGVTRAIMKLLAKANVKKTFNMGLNLDLLSPNPEVVKRHKEDPLRIHECTPRFGAEGLKAREKGFNCGPEITLPVILQQPEDDQILIPDGNKKFFDTIASEDKTFKLYPGLWHEPFEAPGGAEFLADTFAWLDARV